jgi:hypothetical protein
MPQTLQIYISDNCSTCLETKNLVDIIKKRFTKLDVDLINLSHPGVHSPDKVFAVPTYIYNDRVIFLGNPSIQELDAYLSMAPEP